MEYYIYIYIHNLYRYLIISCITNLYLGVSENGINPQVKSIEPIFHLNGKSLDANPVGQAQVCCPLGLSGGWDISTGRHWHSHGSKSLTFKMFFYISPAQVPERTITAYLDVQFNHDYITQLAMWQFWSFQKLVKGKIAEPQIHMISIVYPQAMDEILCFLQIFPLQRSSASYTSSQGHYGSENHHQSSK